ncbi:MAG: hypothetical protein FD168_196 [Desulfobulbaceae bacterium]|nr:MAG: hypothetical protein FD168_196 [Desulfobulbaceae bacterium]
MYLEYYHLAQKPFQINTDPAFLWYGEKHKEALATLKYGLLENKSFLLLTGDVGVGKTTIINALLQVLDKNEMVAVINDPKLEKLDFFLHIARAFGISGDFTSKGQFLLAFRELLLEQHYRGKRLLLIVDECQLLSHDLLEEIRLFSNLEQNGVKLINIFFVGQLEFNDILLLPENKAIRQRITVTYNLPSLSLEETEEYIGHRLSVAGATRKIFEKSAIREIYEFSKGYPRLINVICDRALLTGFISSDKQIDKKTIKECVQELDISLATKAHQERNRIEKTQNKPPAPSARKRFNSFTYAAIGFILLLLLSAFLGSSIPAFAPTFTQIQKILPGIFGKEQAVTFPKPPAEPPTKIPAAAIPPSPPAQVTAQPLPESQPETSVPAKDNVSAENNAPATISKIEAPSKTPDPAPDPLPKKLTISFERDSVDIDAASLVELEKLAKSALYHNTGKIVVHGYTDATGSAQYNMKLAGFRATAVKNILAGKGISPDKIRSVSHVTSPQDSNINQGTRRVEIEIVNE